MENILVIDENTGDLNFITTILREAGYEVIPVSKVVDVAGKLQEHNVRLVIVDYELTPLPGLDLLTLADEDAAQPAPLILLSKPSQRDDALSMMELGVFAALSKPIQIQEFLAIVSRALSYQKLLATNNSLRNLLQREFQPARLVANSSSMLSVPNLIEQAVSLDTPILLEGKTGTGKEFMAKLIHASSPRKNKIYSDLKCDALPTRFVQSELFGQIFEGEARPTMARPGKLAQADGGTLYIHEVSSLPEEAQKGLLDYLQHGQLLCKDSKKPIPVNTRIIAGSTVALEPQVEKGRFNGVLYAELSKLVIPLPPLSQRIDDIPYLIKWFLQKHSGGEERPLEFTPEALALLKQYNWPGNVRELENLIWQFANYSKSDVIDVRNLPEQIQKAGKNGPFFGMEDEDAPGDLRPLNEFTRFQEHAYITQAIEQKDGDKMKAANALGISLTTLYRKIDLDEKD